MINVFNLIPFDMIFLPLAVTFAVITVSFYLWQWTFWRRRGVPGPRSVPFFGNKLSLVLKNKPSPIVFRDWTKVYGKTYGVSDGVQQTLVTSDPVIVQEVFQKQFDNFYERKLFIPNDPRDPRVHMFNANGNRWKRLRTISSPTFTSGNLRRMHATIENSALEVLAHIEKNSSKSIDFEFYFQHFTMDVIQRIALGQTESQMFTNPLVKLLSDRMNFITMTISVLGSCVPEYLAQFVTLGVFKKFTNNKHPILMVVDDCEAAVFARIKQRVSSASETNERSFKEKDLAAGIEPGEPVDFIDLFLDARSDELFDEEEFSKENIKVSRQMTTYEIIGQCLLFLVAGFDTTSIALSFTANLLATHPEVQKKVQEEIARECPNPSIDFDSLTRLKYLEAVVKETLRLNPLAAVVNSRRCVNDTVVGGVPVEKGTYVQIDTLTLHYDKELWGENAEEFVPERLESQSHNNIVEFRWLEGDVNKNNWIPFGHGPRQCIGMRLAILEEKLMLAHLLRKFTIVPGPETKKLEVHGPFVLRPVSTVFNVLERV